MRGFAWSSHPPVGLQAIRKAACFPGARAGCNWIVTATVLCSGFIKVTETASAPGKEVPPATTRVDEPLQINHLGYDIRVNTPSIHGALQALQFAVQRW